MRVIDPEKPPPYRFVQPKSAIEQIEADRRSFVSTVLWVNTKEAQKVLQDRDQGDKDIKENLRMFFLQLDPEDLEVEAPDLWQRYCTTFANATHKNIADVVWVGLWENFFFNMTTNYAWNSFHSENIKFSSNEGFPNHFLRDDGWNILVEHFALKDKKKNKRSASEDAQVLEQDPNLVPEHASKSASRAPTSKAKFGYDVPSVIDIAGLRNVPENLINPCLPVFSRGPPTATALKGKINRLVTDITNKANMALQRENGPELLTAKLLIATCIYLKPTLEHEYKEQNTGAQLQRLCSVLLRKGMLRPDAGLIQEAARVVPALSSMKRQRTSSSTTAGGASSRPRSSGDPPRSGTQGGEHSDESGEEGEEEAGEEDEEDLPLRKSSQPSQRPLPSTSSLERRTKQLSRKADGLKADGLPDRVKEILHYKDLAAQRERAGAAEDRAAQAVMRVATDQVIKQLQKLLGETITPNMDLVSDKLESIVNGVKALSDMQNENKTLLAEVRAIMDKLDDQNVAGTVRAIMDKLEQNMAVPSRDPEEDEQKKKEQEEQAMKMKEHEILTQVLLMDFVKDQDSLKKFWFRMKAAKIPEDRLLALLQNCWELPEDDHEAVTKTRRA